jgi:hypothetical protein
MRRDLVWLRRRSKIVSAPKNIAMISQPARATCLIESLGASSPEAPLQHGRHPIYRLRPGLVKSSAARITKTLFRAQRR